MAPALHLGYVSQTHVWSILPSRNGSIWVGAEGVLARFQDERCTAATNLQAGLVHSHFEDARGQLWIGADAGRFRAAPDSEGFVTIYQATVPHPANGVDAACQDRQGNLWFGNAGGLWRWRDGQMNVYQTKDGLSPGIVSSMAEDAEGALWAAVGGHVNRFQNGKFTQFDSEMALPPEAVNCVCPDREGNIWLGTARSGLVRLRPRLFITYTAQDGLVDDDVWSICEGRVGEMWFGTPTGVSRFADEQFTNDPNVSPPVFQDRSGTVWLGSKGGLAWLRDGN